MGYFSKCIDWLEPDLTLWHHEHDLMIKVNVGYFTLTIIQKEEYAGKNPIISQSSCLSIPRWLRRLCRSVPANQWQSERSCWLAVPRKKKEQQKKKHALLVERLQVQTAGSFLQTVAHIDLTSLPLQLQVRVCFPGVGEVMLSKCAKISGILLLLPRSARAANSLN